MKDSADQHVAITQNLIKNHLLAPSIFTISQTHMLIGSAHERRRFCYLFAGVEKALQILVCLFCDQASSV